jgi:hypothetical protein
VDHTAHAWKSNNTIVHNAICYSCLAAGLTIYLPGIAKTGRAEDVVVISTEDTERSF